MDGTPRLRSAFPATPQRRSEQYAGSPRIRQSTDRLPEIQVLQSPAASSPSTEPWIAEHIIDAPSQRLYAFTIWVALWSYKFYDFYNLQESEEQSLFLFMKWLALDGLWLFGLPSFRIPWLEWSVPTMALLFCAHVTADAMMMFQIPIPLAAGAAVIGRGFWGAQELAINERNVDPRTIEFNESLILGRQIIHILPEGSAILNPDREPFCLDSSRTEARLPLLINATNPIAMDIFRVDLDSATNETIHISKSQIKTMHKEASRLLSYSDKPNDPKTLYYTVKKPGLYALQKVVDESNLEVTRKQMAHTVVVPCPKADFLPTPGDRCRGELSNVELEVIGTPPMRVKYRKLVNQQTQEATFESIMPEDFASPLSANSQQSALVVPRKVETAWARPQNIRVPLNEGLGQSGKWTYSILEVTDGFGNKVTYSDRDHDGQERRVAKASQLHQVITVHERPTVSLQGCSAQNPMKVAKGSSALLPIQVGSTGRGALEDTTYHLEYRFSSQAELSATGEHGASARPVVATVKSTKERPVIQDAGLYTLTGVRTDFCQGEVLEPASCLLQNPPEPQLSINSEEIFDKCAGSPIGLRVDFDLIGTPPFQVKYRMHKAGDRHYNEQTENVNGVRSQIELTPRDAGEYEYEFVEISDSVYKLRPLTGLKLKQNVKPAASAAIIKQNNRVTCIDDQASFEIALHGEGPFSLEYELVHNGKRDTNALSDIAQNRITITTQPLRDGGDYTLALVSVTDQMGCKEFLKDETKISVRHQKPRVGFGHIEGHRSINTLEGRKTQLPLRLAGEAPWTISYVDQSGREHTVKAQHPNDRITVAEQGRYQLTDVRDSVCPGQVDESARDFDVSWIPRPEMSIPPSEYEEQRGSTLIKRDICEGEDETVEVHFRGAAPFNVQYIQHVKPEHGAISPKNKELKAAVGVTSLRMDTAQAGVYDYKFNKLEDSNYDHSAKHFTPLTLQQTVHPRPTASFLNPGKTYSLCAFNSSSNNSEAIPVTLTGTPPFSLEVEIKHHSTAKPSLLTLPHISTRTPSIHIPHKYLNPGASAISLRRITDSRNCARTLDSSSPRVHVAVHSAPTIVPLETQMDYCVGDRITYALSGLPPFSVFYEFEGHSRKATASSTTFRRLAEKPGNFTIKGLTDSASQCQGPIHDTKLIHGLPSVRVSKGRDSYVDIHEGGETEILFEFGGVPPFEFTYTRSANADGKSGKGGLVLDMRHEVSEGRELRVKASEEGTYEVVAVKDRYCRFVKPGVQVQWRDGQKRLTL